MATTAHRVLAHMKERGRIPTATVQSIIGAHRPPSQMLGYLRKRGHIIETDLPRSPTEWIYHGQVETPEQHGQGPDLETHIIYCIRCGSPLQVQTWPGEKPHKWRKCAKCWELKDDSAKGDWFSNNEERRKVTQASRVVKQGTHDQGTVYRPGDKGFEERARAVTHIRDIKDRVTDLAPGVRFSLRY